MSAFPFLLGTPWPLWAIVFAGAGAGVLTWRGYRRRAGEASAQRLNLLKALRLAGWALLFACLLQPIHREFMRDKKASRLTVLLDDSESMSFKDSRTAPPRLDAVKAALLGPQAAAEAAAAKTPPEPERGALLNVLGNTFNVQLEAFGLSSRPIAHLNEVQAGAPGTDIAKALTESFTRLRGPDAGGLVLISDGADTAQGDLERVAAAYKRAGTPIYALGVGNPDVQDLALSQVRCRRTVSKDTLVRVEVEVTAAGLPDGKHLVSITRKGKPVVEPKAVELKNHVGTVVFEFLPDSQGFLEYEAQVEPFPGELVTANNSLAFGLVAYSRKLRILYMEGSMYVHYTYNSLSPGMYSSHPWQRLWEHQFTENALLEDSDVEVDMLAKDLYGIPPNMDTVRLKTVKEAFPKTKKELYQYDVVICADIPYTYFTEDQVQWIVDFVGKHGGGFMMVGGYDSFAEGHYPKTPIDRMLPVEMLDETHVDKHDFSWKLTDEAWSHPIMQVEKDEEKNRAAWARLPQFHGFSKTTRPKPAATVLAVVAEDDFETLYGPAILLAVQPFGNGRSMAFTSDTTGSWGTEWEDSWGPEGAEDLNTRNLYFKNFFKNTVRWLAHYRMQAPNQIVTLESDRLVYGRG
ncbi:MAG: glutamine amidotransferase, partial [Planctomycetota bacterium]